MNRITRIAALIALALSATAALAHEGHERVAGTVTRVEKARIEVKGADGKTTAVALTATTVFKKGKEAASLSDLKTGVAVEVDAAKGKAGLEALEVKIGVAEAAYTCPMHPDVTQDKPGKCPKCGMNLVKKG